MTFLYQNHIIIKFKLTFLGKSVNLITDKIRRNYINGSKVRAFDGYL